MYSIYRIYHKMNIALKLFIITFLLMESIILILGYSYYRHSSSSLLNAQTEYAAQVIDKSNEYLQLNFKNMESFFLSISHDVRFQGDDIEEIKRLLNENLILFIPNAKNIHLIEGSRIIASTSTFSWMASDSPEFPRNLPEIQAANKLYWGQPYFSPVSQFTVTAAMKMISATDGSTKILALDLDLPQLYAALFPNSKSSLQGDLLLLDRENEPLFGRLPFIDFDIYEKKYVHKQLSKTTFASTWSTTNWLDKGKSLFMVRSMNNKMGWQVVWVLNETTLLQPLYKSIQFTWMLALVSLFLSIGVSYLISVLVSHPIRKIASSMNLVSQGELNTSVQLNREDELGLLAKHFNQMTLRIGELIVSLKHTEDKKKEADYLAFQAQIKPHFLYNTLNTIGISAKQGHLAKVDLLISALTDQLHYSLDGAPKLVSLREELDALDSYIALMQIRYPNQFEVEIHIDPSSWGLKLPKFIMQPLVENSIFHGLVPKKEPGTLFIGTSVEPGAWTLIIEDDGAGISGASSEQLNLVIHNAPSQFEEIAGASPSLGFRNVCERLRLTYGDGCKVSLDTSSMGTRISLRLPLHKKEGLGFEKIDPR